MALKPTPGASDGTYGTEMNAFLDVSLDVNGKIATEALQTDATAPVADAAIVNKKYVDDISLSYIKLVDSKASTTAGGGFTSGSWVKRTVTEETDIGANVSISSSVIVLAAGTYQCRISAPAFSVDAHQIRLRNTTGGSTVLVGTSEFNTDTAEIQTRSVIVGRFTVSGSQNLEIQHQAGTTKATNGLGVPNSFGEAEIYTIAEFWKK